MSNSPLLKTFILLSTLPALAGCVGYNTALFMTKSNAGLDFDAKPPTAEINISRKEGVVEPSFEGGKTPPVEASFSTRTGADDGLHRFFLGVNQTFSGGDAAVTMAKLYDQTDPPDPEKARAEFDSALTLSQPPKANQSKGFLGWRKRLFGLAEPGEVRPFFFGTDTQMGLKVAWNGVGGPYPDNVKIGFNRKEIAVAPITISNNVVRIPSFLATVDADANAGNNVGVSWLQYFATGESASLLARQYGVRKAMLERADPKAADAAEKERLRKVGAVDPETIKKKKALADAHKDAQKAPQLEEISRTVTGKADLNWPEFIRNGTALDFERTFNSAKAKGLVSE